MRFKAALIDLSGTLHIDGQAIPGAVAALERLRAAQLPCRFVTNTTKDTVDSLVMTLQTLGFGISKDEVFSSLSATRQLLKQRDLRPLLLLDRRALPEFDDVPQHDPNAVVVGLAREAFNYDSLNRAFRLLHAQPAAPLIAIHRGRVFAEASGLSLGPGPFVTALEVAAGRTAQVVGKPAPTFFAAALDHLGVASEHAVMIGDDVRDDVQGAQAAGLAGVLVQTGKYQLGDEGFGAPAASAPDATVPDFAAAVDWLLSQ
uniref:Haloacid dehalogenase-like hydrolase domain-containing protein 2 n=1 Tax=Auxenochlorella protothecoides TaxID=3075 RepID=A0A1D2A5M4_AUXPR